MAEDWHVLTVTHGGMVSLIKNLTEATARDLAKRLNPWHGRPNGFGMMVDSGTITRIEVISPVPETAP